MRDLFEAILGLEDPDEVERFLRDLCTLGELQAMAHRWEVVKLVERDHSASPSFLVIRRATP